MKDVFDEIKKIVSEEIGVKESKLFRETRIYEDLKVDADDAFELLKSFGEEFDVDMRNFDFNSYFASEGVDLIGVVLGLFKKNKAQMKSITLGHLEKVALNGAWIET